VAIPDFLTSGKDGYMCLQNPRYILAEEHGLLLSTLIRRHLMEIEVLAVLEETSVVFAAANKWMRLPHEAKHEKLPVISPSTQGRITIVTS